MRSGRRGGSGWLGRCGVDMNRFGTAGLYYGERGGELGRGWMVLSGRETAVAAVVAAVAAVVGAPTNSWFSAINHTVELVSRWRPRSRCFGLCPVACGASS